MNHFAEPSRLLKGLKNRASAFYHCSRAIAAVEFALLLPILLSLFMGTFELTRAIEVNRKVNNAANTVADLVTQTDMAALQGSLSEIMSAGQFMMSPFEQAGLEIVVSAIRLDTDGNPEVQWSITCYGTRLATNAPPPAKYQPLNTLYAEDVDLIVAEASYQYQGVFGGLLNIGNLIFDFNELAPYRPRTTDFMEPAPNDNSIC